MTGAAAEHDARADFRQSVRAALARTATIQAPVWQPETATTAALAQAASLGWLGLLVDEQWDGAGAGLAEAVIVAEELGAQLSPLPFLSSAILATSALSVGGSREQQDRWLPALASGTARATLLPTGPSGRIDPGLIDVQAVEDGRGVVLRGTAGFVLDADGADLLLVAARRTGGSQTELFAVEGGRSDVEITSHLGVDRTRQTATVVLHDVVVDTAARLPHGPQGLEAALARGSVALAADAVGAARRALDLAVQYAKQREQFGRPIGSFQAIKHKLADMYLLVQGAALAVEGAATSLDRTERAGALVAVAGAYARDAASKVTGDAIQVHGGIGYTWEHDCHRLFKRAKFDELYLGDPSVHREELARHVLERASALSR